MKKTSQFSKLAMPVITFVLAMIVCGIVVLAMGYNPFQVYKVIIMGTFKSAASMGNVLANSIPLMLAGFAVSIAGKAGILNLGVEGQLYVGGMMGTLVALFAPVSNKFLLMVLVFGASILGGMIWGGLVGVLKVKFGTNEVIVALMLNYVAQLFTTWLVADPLKEPNAAVNRTAMIPESLWFARLVPKTQITATIFIALFVGILIWFIFKYTSLGYKIKSVGSNAKAALANGINCNKYIILSMCFSGAVAGLIGITEITSKYYRFTEGFSNDIGFTGVAIAALAGYNPFGVMVVSLLFGILNSGSMALGRELGISSELFMVIEGIIVLFVGTPYLIKFFSEKKSKLVKKGDK